MRGLLRSRLYFAIELRANVLNCDEVNAAEDDRSKGSSGVSMLRTVLWHAGKKTRHSTVAACENLWTEACVSARELQRGDEFTVGDVQARTPERSTFPWQLRLEHRVRFCLLGIF